MTGTELGLILCAAATYEVYVTGISYLIAGAAKATRKLRSHSKTTNRAGTP